MSGGYDRPWASSFDSPLLLRPQQLTEMQIVVQRFEVGLAVQRTHHCRAVSHPGARDRGGAEVNVEALRQRVREVRAARFSVEGDPAPAEITAA